MGQLKVCIFGKVVVIFKMTDHVYGGATWVNILCNEFMTDKKFVSSDPSDASDRDLFTFV